MVVLVPVVVGRAQSIADAGLTCVLQQGGENMLHLFMLMPWHELCTFAHHAEGACREWLGRPKCRHHKGITWCPFIPA